MLNKLRHLLEPATSKLGAAAAKTGIPPSGWTALSLATASISACLYISPERATYAGVILLVSGFFDMVDGAVARATSRVSSRGAFLDSSLDRLGEVIVFTGILIGGYAPPYIALLALAFSMLVSYCRARGEALGVRVFGVGVGERAERLIILSLFSIAGFVYLGVWVVLALALATFVQRFTYVMKALDRS